MYDEDSFSDSSARLSAKRILARGMDIEFHNQTDYNSCWFLFISFSPSNTYAQCGELWRTQSVSLMPTAKLRWQNYVSASHERMEKQEIKQV